MPDTEQTRPADPATLQVAEWASGAATSGRHQDTLSWLRALNIVIGSLPMELRWLHRHSTVVVRERAEAHDERRRRLTQTPSS